MNESLAVGQFAIIDHEPVDRAPCVGIFRGRGPAGDRPELYLLSEGTTPVGEQFAAHVISSAGQAWAASDVSLTGSLLRLFVDAEKSLRDWNSKSIDQHQVRLGLGAIVRRGGQVVLAQVGPSLAFHLKEGAVRVYGPDEDHLQPLGGDRPAEPHLRGLVVGPGDRLLLISTGALELADHDLIAAILGLPPEEALRDLYQRVRSARSISVLLLTMPVDPLPGGAQQPPEQEAEFEIGGDTEAGSEDEFVIGLDTPASGFSSEPYQPSLFLIGGRRVPPGSVDPAQSKSNIRSHLPELEEDPLEPLRPVSGVSPLGPAGIDGTDGLLDGSAPPGPDSAREPGSERPRMTRRNPRSGESFSRGLLRRDDPVVQSPRDVHTAPRVEVLAQERKALDRAIGATDEAFGIEAGEAIASTLPLIHERGSHGGRWRASGALSQRRSPLERVRRLRALPIAIIALAAVLVVALFVLPGQFSESSEERYVRLVADAGEAILTAQEEEDPGVRRDLLTEAWAMLLEARDLHSEASEVVRLLEDVSVMLQKMDAVRSPVLVETVASLAEFGEAPLAVTRLAVGEAHVFLLDPTAGVVVAVALNGSERKVAYEREVETGAGAPVAITGLDTATLGREMLLIDEANSLWSLDVAGNIRQVAFAPPEGFAVTDVTTNGGALYVLDAASQTIYRFESADSDFGIEPESVVTGPVLSGARYILVSDGVVTVSNDGSVHRFDGALALQLSQAGIDQPIVAAEPPHATDVPGEVAILDAAADRVVVFGRDGTFLRQYQHDSFAQITALVISPSGSYVFSGGELRRVIWD